MPQDDEIIRLLRNITNAVTNKMNKYYDSYGLTSVQFLVLMELCEQDNISLSQLANQLHMSLSNLSAIVKRMEAHDLLIRKRSAADDRIVIICLQQKARELVQSMKANILCQQPLGIQLSEQQKEEIIHSLQLVNDLIEKECFDHE